jgi:competence protein ComEA
VADTWRVLEDPSAATPAATPAPGGDSATASGQPTWILLAAGTVVAVVAAVWLMFSGPSGSAVAVNAAHGAISLESDAPSAAPSGSAGASTDPQRVVVEINGAVPRPGIYRVAPGARVGEVIAAAGGYGGRVDALAAEALNLAEKVQDGQQIHVPARGERATGADPAGQSTTGASNGDAGKQPAGRINVNTASSSELDALPGIGPATAAKIVAARSEQPFASVDDLRERKVVGASTLEKIRDLVVVR